MKSLALLTGIMLSLHGGFSASMAEDMASRTIQENWLEVTYNKNKMGYRYTRIQQIRHEGQDCYKFTSRTVYKSRDNQGTIRNRTEEISYITDRGFSPVNLVHKCHTDDQITGHEIFVTGKQLVIKSTLPEPGKEHKIPLSNNVLFDANGFILKTKGLLQTGTIRSYKTISLTTKRLATETLKVIKQESVNCMGKDINAYLIHITNSERPGLLRKLHVDQDGRELKTCLAGITELRTTEEQATRFDKIGSLVRHIKTNIILPFPHRLTRLNLKMTHDRNLADIVPNNEYQQVTGSGKSYSVILKQITLDPENTFQIPAKTASLQRFLRPSPLIQSQHPAITKLAKEIIDGETDALKAIGLIVEWIYTRIKPSSNASEIKSSLDTLKEKSGDCTEFATLFCALARAAGVPSRTVAGLIFKGNRFGYHVWNESHLGKWIPVDTTLNRIGIPAVYLKLSEGGEKQDRKQEMVKLTQIPGNTSIQITGFRDTENRFVDLSTPGNHTVQKGNSWENKISGITVSNPSNWLVKTGGKGGISLTNPQSRGTTVTIRPLPLGENSLTVDIANRVVSDGCARLGNVERTPLFETEVSGHRSFESTFSGTIGTTINLKFRTVIVQGNGKTFMISCCCLTGSYEKHTDTFNEILKSIKF